jgi:hypothetical protein
VADSTDSTRRDYPRTITAAVDLVLSRMTDEMKAWMRRFKGDEADLRVELATGITPGMSVRAMLGLWGKNPDLLAQIPPPCRHPDDASTYILVECWRRLRARSR